MSELESQRGAPGEDPVEHRGEDPVEPSGTPSAPDESAVEPDARVAPGTPPKSDDGWVDL
jgi:hypothetical protein